MGEAVIVVDEDKNYKWLGLFHHISADNIPQDERNKGSDSFTTGKRRIFPR